MTREAEEQGQALQRVKVGMTGLAGVIVLIGLASAIFSSALHGGNHARVAAATANSSIANTSEPLAEIGAAPGASETLNTSGAVGAR
jgi:hypothetical protein